MEDSKEELKAAIRKALNEILAEQKPMTVPVHADQATEIVIRSSPSEAVVHRLQGNVSPAIVTQSALPPTIDVGPWLSRSVAQLLDPRSEQLLQAIGDKTGETSEEVMVRLNYQIIARQLIEEIRKYAEELGIE